MRYQKGHFVSEDTRHKIRFALLGRKTNRILWNKGQKGIIVSPMKGKKRDEEFNLKQSLSMKQRYQDGLKVWNKGLKGSVKPNITTFKKGLVPCNKGKKGIYSEEYIEKLKKSHSEKFVEKSSNWRGGKSLEPYSFTFNRQLKDRIRNRDNFKCCICGVPEMECNQKLHIHHIDYNKKNCEDSNLISLCIKCHFKTNGNRKYWESLFKGKKIESMLIEKSGGAS